MYDTSHNVHRMHAVNKRRWQPNGMWIIEPGTLRWERRRERERERDFLFSLLQRISYACAWLLCSRKYASRRASTTIHNKHECDAKIHTYKWIAKWVHPRVNECLRHKKKMLVCMRACSFTQQAAVDLIRKRHRSESAKWGHIQQQQQQNAQIH